jgi:hypothetical protein
VPGATRTRFSGEGDEYSVQHPDLTALSSTRRSSSWRGNQLFHIRYLQIVLSFLKISLLKSQRPAKWLK